MPHSGHWIIVAMLFTLGLANAGAQTTQALADVPHPRVAVVLSGGSAKGLAHIGALAVIEEFGIPIDAVTGTSMGSMIGGLYAAGYSPDKLDSMSVTEDWDTFFKRPVDRRLQASYERSDDERFTIKFPLEHARPSLPPGVISRQSIAEHLEHYLWPVHDVTDFRKLPTAFGALVTDLATGDAILLQSGSLAQAIEGSAAVPGAFAPLTLADGRVVVDGAVNRNIPAEDARAMGADILICIDVSERIQPVAGLRSLVDILDQTVAFRVQLSNDVERPLCNVVISPEIGNLSSADFRKGAEWIRRGRTAATARGTELQAIADSVRRLRGPRVPRRGLPSVDSVFVSKVERSKVSAGADAIAHGAINLRDGMWVTQRQVEITAARIFATGRFRQVSYRVEPRNGEEVLTFDLDEADRDVLGLGVRYDTPQGAALLASASIADIISPGSTASASARLGAIQRFDARDVLGEGVNAPFLQTYHFTLTRAVLPTGAAPGATRRLGLSVSQVAAEIARPLLGSVVAGVDASHEWSRDGSEDGAGPFALTSKSLTVVGATVSRDTRNTIAFPTRGTYLLWRTEAAPFQSGERDFARHLIAVQGALSLGGGVSLQGNAHWGSATGANLPLHDWFFLGGGVPSDVWGGQYVPFDGLDPQSVAGRSVRVLQSGVQVQAPEDVIVTLRGDLGGVFDAAPASQARAGYRAGAGLNIGRQFSPGPVSITFGTRSLRQRPVVELQFGALF